MAEIGRRICVYGPTGSGKSTLAGIISQKVGVPHIELDAIFWKPDWVESSLEEFRANISVAIGKCPDGWVTDGNYSHVRDLILPLADTVVWLRPPLRVAFWRLLNRTIKRCLDRNPVCGTNIETWRGAFFNKDSLLLYQFTHWRAHSSHMIESLNTIPHNARIIELRSQKEVDAFLKTLG